MPVNIVFFPNKYAISKKSSSLFYFFKLLSNSKHTCSVISRTPVQLLVISDDVFADIFVNQNQNNKLNKKHLLDLLNRKAKLNHYLISHPNAKLPHIRHPIESVESNSVTIESSKNKKINMDDIKVRI